MWTPRRLLLLILGLGIFLGAFSVYASILGGIDGLPPLPAEFLVHRSAADGDIIIPVPRTVIDSKLQQAFGINCPETNYNHKLELGKKGIVLASNDIRIEADGRCRVSPFSLAVFKDRGNGQFPEVNTIRCKVAYLIFNEPVRTLPDMGARQIVGCDLDSDPQLLSPDPRHNLIHFTNNRGTSSPNDDLTLETLGPVKYRELPNPPPPDETAPPQVWTDAAIKLVDRRGSPQSTTITAQGMQVFLNSDPPDTTPAGKQKKPGRMSGVKRVILPANVCMNLWTEPGSGFLSAGPAAGAKPSPERSNVQITTMGPFYYKTGIDADTARFDQRPAGPDLIPSFVQVVRPHNREDGAQSYDRLECDSLELQFGHGKPATGSPASTNNSGQAVATAADCNLEWIHAWGQFLVLTSDDEKLVARGNDLFHDTLTKQSILKGSPEMVAIKDGNEIHAPELVMFGADAKDGQQAQARGAGYLKLRVDKTSTAAFVEQRVIMARWTDRLIYRKLGVEELMTLIGSAHVEDPAHDQTLDGDQIKFLMAADPQLANAPPRKDGDESSRLKPKRLEVNGHVKAVSPELHIYDSKQLVMLFNNIPAPPPENSPANAPGTPGKTESNQPIQTTLLPPPPDPALERKPSGPPLELKAGIIQAFLTSRAGQSPELDTVHCEGDVRVDQKATLPQTKPVKMEGQTLQLTRKPDGHILVVTGDAEKPAIVELPELSLMGPIVDIDQIDNIAKVHGPGGMTMLSTTDLQGNKLAKPTELQIAWKNDMHFNGKMARFHGQVQAVQENTRLLCNSMQVTLDRPVSLNTTRNDPTATPGAKTANVEKVICDADPSPTAPPVSVVEEIRDGNRIIRYQRIESRELAVFKSEGKLEAPGPGQVRLLQMGSKEVAAAPAQPQAKVQLKSDKPAEEELKLTWIRYERQMTVNQEKRTAQFWKNVEVLHLPADDPALKKDLSKVIDNLPPNALYMKAERLTIYTQEDANGRKTQFLRAEEKASVQGEQFSGMADVIKYNEALQQVIFEGSPSNPAKLYKMQGRGQKPQKFVGEKFTYSRLTNQFDGANMIMVNE